MEPLRISPLETVEPDRLARDLTALRDALLERLGPRLVALLLLGGYARGEGGWIDTGRGWAPFNDYDLVAVVDRSSRGVRRLLSDLGHAWGAKLEVDVDLWAISRSALARPPRTLLWLDAALGGVRVLHGPSDVVAPLHRLEPRHIPLSECARLLANRAVGLALSNLERVNEGSEESALRAARHAHKAAIACGDVRLLAADRYAGSLRERARSLTALAAAPGVGHRLVAAYADAVAFRERPDRWQPPRALATWYAELRREVAGWHLSFEAWRVGTPTSPFGFARHRGWLYADAADLRAGLGWAAHARAVASGAAPLLSLPMHPRERLARVAVLLAYAAEAPVARRAAARLLGARDTADATLHRSLVDLARMAG